MIALFDSIRDVSYLSILVRELLSFTLGACIGLERSSKNRPAGLRTHVLVAIAAATAAITGHYIYLGMGITSDLTRIGAQVIAGMGFIGAGTIIVTKQNAIKGLTTAAGLWATGVVGLAIGSGFYEGGIFAACLILLIETGFSGVASRISKVPEASILVCYNDKAALDHVLRMAKDMNISISSLQIEHTEEKRFYTASISLRGSTHIEDGSFLEIIRGITGIVSAEPIQS